MQYFRLATLILMISIGFGCQHNDASEAEGDTSFAVLLARLIRP